VWLSASTDRSPVSSRCAIYMDTARTQAYNGIASLSPASRPFTRSSHLSRRMDMPAKTLPKRSRLRLVVFNDSAPVLKMFCTWLQEHGHECHAALLAEMPQAQDDVGPVHSEAPARRGRL